MLPVFEPILMLLPIWLNPPFEFEEPIIPIGFWFVDKEPMPHAGCCGAAAVVVVGGEAMPKLEEPAIDDEPPGGGGREKEELFDMAGL
jgi:hypothetical protein